MLKADPTGRFDSDSLKRDASSVGMLASETWNASTRRLKIMRIVPCGDRAHDGSAVLLAPRIGWSDEDQPVEHISHCQTAEIVTWRTGVEMRERHAIQAVGATLKACQRRCVS